MAAFGKLVGWAVVLAALGATGYYVVWPRVRGGATTKYQSLAFVRVDMYDENALAPKYTAALQCALRLPKGFGAIGKFDPPDPNIDLTRSFHASDSQGFEISVSRSVATRWTLEDDVMNVHSPSWTDEGPIALEGRTRINGMDGYLVVHKKVKAGIRERIVFLAPRDGARYFLVARIPEGRYDACVNVADSSFSTFVSGEAARGIGAP